MFWVSNNESDCLNKRVDNKREREKIEFCSLVLVCGLRIEIEYKQISNNWNRISREAEIQLFSYFSAACTNDNHFVELNWVQNILRITQNCIKIARQLPVCVRTWVCVFHANKLVRINCKPAYVTHFRAFHLNCLQMENKHENYWFLLIIESKLTSRMR